MESSAQPVLAQPTLARGGPASEPALQPAPLAAFLLMAGAVLAIAGVYVLAGTGWALLAASIPVSMAGGVLMRGLIRGG